MCEYYYTASNVDGNYKNLDTLVKKCEEVLTYNLERWNKHYSEENRFNNLPIMTFDEAFSVYNERKRKEENYCLNFRTSDKIIIKHTKFNNKNKMIIKAKFPMYWYRYSTSKARTWPLGSTQCTITRHGLPLILKFED